jgi:tRNA A37 threonylcarbamoyladenosine modification protein TsaB
LRIGVSFAKSFAWAAGVPVIPIASFEALALAAALRHRDAPCAIATLRDARSEGFFAAIFDVTAPTPRRLVEDSVWPLAQVEAALIERGRSGLTLCGDLKCLDTLRPLAKANGWRVADACTHIPARAVAELGWARAQKSEGVLRDAASIHKLAPLYLRASDPELKFNVAARGVEIKSPPL